MLSDFKMITRENIAIVRDRIVASLKAKGYAVEVDKNGIAFSLSAIGLVGVWARIDNEELEYQADNLETEE